MPVKIVGRSPLMTELLISKLSESGYQVDEAAKSVHALSPLGDKDIVVLHALETCKNVPSSVAYLKSMNANVSIVILCAESSLAEMREQLGSDVNAILPDTTEISLVLSSLSLVGSGLHIIHPTQFKTASRASSEDISAEVDRKKRIEAAIQLSLKEGHVLGGLESGLSNKAIANKMGIKEATVKVHLRSIYQKLGVNNRTQAALWSRTRNSET